MIIRRTPEDFFVEERTNVNAGEGPFTLYRLEKKGWTTPDALAAIRRRWKIDGRRLSYGGLKDRHAHTIQHFTILRGPQRKLTHSGIDVTCIGQVSEPFTSEHIQANRFRLVLRRMTETERDHALEQLPIVREVGVPNYFDDQRFGSVAGGGPFMARYLLQGDHDAALRTALTAPYPHDRKEQKLEKRVLKDHWLDWPTAKEKLPRGHARSLVDYLVHHPQDFRGAIARMRPELRGLYLSAYQSGLWNRILAAWLRGALTPEQLLDVELLLGPVPMHRQLTPEQRTTFESLRIALPSPKVRLPEEEPITSAYRAVLEEEGVTLEQFRLKGLKEVFFSRGDRAALCMPESLEWTEAHDDMHPGKNKLTLSFDLPRGSYATLIVKRVSMGPEEE